MRKVYALFLIVTFFALPGDRVSAGWEDAEECLSAKEEAESAAQELSSAADSLGSCADSEDFDDDCSSEFYRVQSAHGDYESAVSEIGSYCD